jgi:hypothetical protein
MPEIGAIIAAAGLDPDELARTVAEWRDRSFHMETVLADHFDVEELAATVEVLAAEISRVRELAAGDESPLAQAILARAETRVPEPAMLLADPGPDAVWTQRLVFGYPLLRRFGRAWISDAGRMVRQDIIVHTETGTWTALTDGESVTGACARLLTREQEFVES